MDGTLQPGVTAKDIILALIAQIGIGGGTGSHLRIHRLRRSARLNMEQRMTICNMSIEGGARAGHDRAGRHHFRISRMAATSRPRARSGTRRSSAGSNCPRMKARRTTGRSRSTPTTLEPMITYGTNPGMGMPITAAVPDPSSIGDHAGTRIAGESAALHGPGRRQTAARPSDRRRVHRLLHQFAHQRSAQRGRDSEGPQGEPRRCA